MPTEMIGKKQQHTRFSLWNHTEACVILFRWGCVPDHLGSHAHGVRSDVSFFFKDGTAETSRAKGA